MGRGRNKLRIAAGLIGLSFFRHKYKIVKFAHIGRRTRSEDQFLYAKVQFILVPPHFQVVPPYYACYGDGTGIGVARGARGPGPSPIKILPMIKNYDNIA